MKKYLMASALAFSIAAPSLAFAQEHTPTASPLTGFYIGGQVGYANADSSTPLDTNVNIEGMDYGVFLGIQLDQYFQNNIGINAALEAHYNRSRADGSSAFGVDFEKDYDWGISFRPGFSIAQSINPYAIIGYRRANFDAVVGGVSESANFDGFELGVGTELVAYGRYGVRLDYSHTWYETNNGFNPSEHNVRLGVAYHF